MIKRIKTYFSYLYNYLKDIWFFIYTKKDLKLDFPFPPKPFYRVFKIVFWKRFFPHYRRRKKSELKFSDIEKTIDYLGFDSKIGDFKFLKKKYKVSD